MTDAIEATVNRCREYVKKHGDKTSESRAFEVLLGELDRLRSLLEPANEPVARELTVDGALMWMQRWDDVPLALWPHSVKLLLVVTNAVQWHRGQRERMIEELNRLVRDASAMKESLKVSLELTTLGKEP